MRERLLCLFFYDYGVDQSPCPVNKTILYYTKPIIVLEYGGQQSAHL